MSESSSALLFGWSQGVWIAVFSNAFLLTALLVKHILEGKRYKQNLIEQERESRKAAACERQIDAVDRLRILTHEASTALHPRQFHKIGEKVECETIAKRYIALEEKLTLAHDFYNKVCQHVKSEDNYIPGNIKKELAELDNTMGSLEFSEEMLEFLLDSTPDTESCDDQGPLVRAVSAVKTLSIETIEEAANNKVLSAMRSIQSACSSQVTHIIESGYQDPTYTCESRDESPDKKPSVDVSKIKKRIHELAAAENEDTTNMPPET